MASSIDCVDKNKEEGKTEKEKENEKGNFVIFGGWAQQKWRLYIFAVGELSMWVALANWVGVFRIYPMSLSIKGALL